MNKVVFVNVLIVFAIYTVIAFFGYFTFTSDLRSNLLDVFAHYAGDTWYLHLANIAMLFCMCAHYPLPCFGLRRTVESLIWHDADAPTLWRYLICLLIIVITTLVGSFITEIHVVLDYTSSLAGSCVVFIFPAIFSFALWKQIGGRLRLFMSIAAMATGLFVMIAGLACTIYTAVDE